MKLEDYKVHFRHWETLPTKVPDGRVEYAELGEDLGILYKYPYNGVSFWLCWLDGPKTGRPIQTTYSPEVIEQLVALCKLRFDL